MKGKILMHSSEVLSQTARIVAGKEWELTQSWEFSNPIAAPLKVLKFMAYSLFVKKEDYTWN